MALLAAHIMTPSVRTVRPEASVAEVARTLTDNDISAVPVCDADGRLLGMLSEGDLVRAVGSPAPGTRHWWLNLLSDHTDSPASFLECIGADQHRARHLMTTPVITADADATVQDLAALLTQHGIKRLPVLRDGALVGIVSRADLVRALARTPDAVAEAL